MGNLFNQKIMNADKVFDTDFLDIKVLYLYYFNSLPDISYVYQLDGEKAFTGFMKKFNDQGECVHKYRWYKRSTKRYEFSTTIVVMKNNCLLEFDCANCQILHGSGQQVFVDDVTALVNQFKRRERREPLEINLIVKGSSGLDLKAMEGKRSKMDLSIFYEDDFIQTDELIRKRLNKKNDKGIVLLHGLPGSGKTSYLRYLVGKIKKKILFLSPSVAGNLMNPDFIELLIDNPNSVVVIEDAENIIMDRKHNSSSAVSNLLNISDGLLADFLNVQLICTFNNSLDLIDNALMRKGRLIAKYEFGKLSVAKAQRLSNHFGFKTVINKPMTIAELSNQHEREFESKRMEVIGFRTHLMEV